MTGKDNSGAIFKNERKEKESHPDYKGKAKINGQEFEIAAWINEAKSTGKKYMALSFKPSEQNKTDSGW